MSLIVKLRQLEIKDEKNFELSAEELELTNPRLKKRVKAHLDIFKGKDFVRVQGMVKTTIIVTCSRCLEEVELPIDEGFRLDYIMGMDPYVRMERVALKKEDIERIYFQGDSIDLGIGIRDTIILATPIAPLCKEACAGICLKCGKNLNKGKCECK